MSSVHRILQRAAFAKRCNSRLPVLGALRFGVRAGGMDPWDAAYLADDEFESYMEAYKRVTGHYRESIRLADQDPDVADVLELLGHRAELEDGGPRR